jgi:hypothetical protein
MAQIFSTKPLSSNSLLTLSMSLNGTHHINQLAANRVTPPQPEQLY